MYKQPVKLNPSNCFPSLPTLKIWVRKLSSPITSKRKIKTRPLKYLNQKKIKGNSRWYISLWKNSVFTVFFFHTRVRWLIQQLIAVKFQIYQPNIEINATKSKIKKNLVHLHYLKFFEWYLVQEKIPKANLF